MNGEKDSNLNIELHWVAVNDIYLRPCRTEKEDTNFAHTGVMNVSSFQVNRLLDQLEFNDRL